MNVITNTAENQIISSQTEGFEKFTHAYDPLAITANFKTVVEDFVVDERLPFELSGAGEHAWLHIQKRNCNTDWVAKLLAKAAGVRSRCVGFAGMKDRHGLTTQWFSVHLPGIEDPDWSVIESDEIRILETKRHRRKLRRGALKENRFHIVLRNISSANEGVKKLVDQRCQRIAEQGVPNYFGEQRFGHQLGNLASAAEMFTNKSLRLPRNKKSIYLSAARSWLFNNILSQRVEQGLWNQRVTGDVFMLDGKKACFWDDESPDLEDRLNKGEIHPTAVLWGEGPLVSKGLVAEQENRVVDAHPVFRDGLCEFKVQQMRRSMRVIPSDMVWELRGDELTLAFNLPSGSYATMVLRELGDITEAKSNLSHRGHRVHGEKPGFY
jgi:tRNA pseudouridine13 synthase